MIAVVTGPGVNTAPIAILNEKKKTAMKEFVGIIVALILTQGYLGTFNIKMGREYSLPIKTIIW